MKLLIENFKNFLHENDDPTFEKLRRLLLNGGARNVISAFELAASIDDQLLRDLLLEYSKMWHYVENSKFASLDDDEPEWAFAFDNGLAYMNSSDFEEILDKIKEIMDTHGEHYDYDDLSKMHDMQEYIEDYITYETIN